MKKYANSYLSAYRGLSPSVWWLSIVMLVNRMGTMVLPFMTLYMTESMNVSIGKAGLVMTIFGMGTICGAFVGGKLTDKIGFYHIQVASLLGGGIMFIVLGLMNSYMSICITTFFLSFINEAFRPANSAALAHYSDSKNRTRSFTLNRLAINLGWAIGGTLGGFVAAKSYHLLFWIDGFTNIIAAVLLWILLAPKRNVAPQEDEENEPPKKSAYQDIPFIVFLVMNTVFACCFLQVFTTIPVYFKQELLLSESDIGITLAINGLIIAIIEMAIIHKLENKYTPLTFVMIGTILVSLSFIVLNILPGYFMLAVIFISIMTIGEIINMPFAATFWVNRSTKLNRGQYAGLFTISWAVAQIAGPGLGAYTAQKLGFDNLWWIMSAVCFATIAGYKWIERKSKTSS